ncbi:uncharacterized protein LOC111040217 [Myzus persicae]|uniref:uncharacterized protein LOC111040217 n=1 Tax=Myzus persicae TaxID=13164 RepID=UPI000B939ED4|nr:uncharacterized protein LOC111040217 [Myzus persicae]
MNNSFPEIFKIIDIDHSGQKKKFVFQEIPEHYYDEIINKLIYEYWSDEITYRSLNVLNDPVSALDIKNTFKKYLAHKMSIGVFECKENDENKLVGLNILFRENINSLNISNLNSNYYERIFYFINTFKKSYVEQLIGNEDYLTSEMLFVCKDYRKLGLARQLLGLRNYVGKKHNFKYTISNFSSPIAEKLAENEGFKKKSIFNYNDVPMVDNDKNCSFKDKSFSCMIKYIL